GWWGRRAQRRQARGAAGDPGSRRRGRDGGRRCRPRRRALQEQPGSIFGVNVALTMSRDRAGFVAALPLLLLLAGCVSTRPWRECPRPCPDGQITGSEEVRVVSY